jgi:hypothetical protein
MKTTRPARLLALGLLTAACAAEKPPDVPSWDLDVFPILRGSCSHCHGVTAAPGGNPFTRYDVCNAAAFNSMGLTVTPGASATVGAFVRDSVGPARMPPPPAAPLSDYEATVLERWAKRPSCDKQVPNRKPIVRIIQPLTRSGNKATVTIEVSDPDGDQVMGKVKLGNGADAAGNPFIVPGAGRWTIEYANAGANDRLSILMFDGYEAAQFMP